MYAPTFQIWGYASRKVWHMVDPSNLSHAACNPRAVLNGVEMRPDVPAGAEYCKKCERREPSDPGQAGRKS